MATATPTLFDVEGARRAGYSDGEILQHLAPSVKFDVTGALKAGYQPTEVLGHLQTSAAVQSVPRPAPPSELAPDDFMGRVGERISSNLSLPFRALDTALDAQHGNEHGTAEYNFGLTTPAGKAAGKRDLQAEAAAGHHITGRDTFGSSPLGTVAGAVTLGPRMIYDQVRGWIQDPATLVGDIGTAALAHAATGEGGVPANKQFGARSLPPPPPELALAPEQQASYTAALDKANAPYVKQLAAEDLAGRQRGIAERLQQNVQQTHETVRNGLNQRWNALREKVGDAPVATKPIIDAIDKSRQMLAGTPTDLKIFNQIVNDLSNRGAEELTANMPTEPSQLSSWLAEHGQGAPPAPSGIPFNDARTQYSALGEQWSNADGNLRRALKNSYDAYGKQIEMTAEAKGAGGEYSDLKRDWSQYVNDWQGKSPLAKVRNAPHPAYVTPIVKGVGSDLLAEQMARYQDAGADPAAVAEMKVVTKQGKLGPLKPVPVPIPEPPEPGLGARLASHMPRVIGKVIGGAAGSAVGHPLIGYSVGGEVGSELGKKMTRPAIPAIPRSPEEYTRTILASKGMYGPEHEIPTGEVDRRVRRGGGKVKVQPLPSPPQ